MIINEKELSEDILSISKEKNELIENTETQKSLEEAEIEYIDSIAEIMNEYIEDIEEAFNESGYEATETIPLNISIPVLKSGFDKAINKAVINMTLKNKPTYKNPPSINKDVMEYENPFETKKKLINF